VHGNLDNKLWTHHCLGFIVEIIKAICSKEKTNSRFLHAHTLFCMTEKDLFIGGWVGLGQLLVAARQTVQCSSVFVMKSFKMPNFTNVELTDIPTYLQCGAAGGNAVQAQILYRA
jgi:hypothetical protein